MGLGFRGIAMPLLIFALATLPTAQADPSPPLPPIAVQATAADPGILVSWTPPPAGDEAVLAYHVLRLDAAAGGWHEVGFTDGSEVSFLDASPFDGVAAYSVTAETADGPSAMSAPAVTGTACSIVGLSGTPPQPVVNWDCLWGTADRILRGTGSATPCGTVGASCMPAEAIVGDGLASDTLGHMCAILVVAGTPPQVGINWDCIIIVVEPRIVRG